MDHKKAHEFYQNFKEISRDEYISLLDSTKDSDERAFFAELWGYILRERQMKVIKR